jgi:ligand-binding sensor domain-containing protein
MELKKIESLFKMLLLQLGTGPKIFSFLIFLFFFKLFPVETFGQSEAKNIKFDYLGIEHGLSQSFVYDILRDSKGFMWFATGYGLNRFDGYSFTIFKNDPFDANSISNNNIRSLLEDLYGNIWMGTFINGISVYDPQHQAFSHFSHSDLDTNTLSSNVVNALHLHNETIWVGTSNGLNRFNQNDSTFTRFLHVPGNVESLSDNNVQSILTDKDGNLWVGTWNGLNRFNPLTNSFERFYADGNIGSLNDNTILSLYQDQNGTIWIGTRRGGVCRYDSGTNSFHHLPNFDSDTFGLSSSTVLSIESDSKGHLWIGTWNGGLNRYDPITGTFEYYFHGSPDAGNTGHNQVWKVYNDHFGSLWFGTHGGGIYKYVPERPRFLHCKHQPDNSNSLSDNTVLSLYEDKMEILWIGTYSGGLNKLDKKGNFETFKANASQKEKGTINNRVGPVIEDRKGNLWIGNSSADDVGGLSYYIRETKTFIHYMHDSDNPNSLSYDNVWSLLMDEDDILWIGTGGGGLNRLDPEKGLFKHFRHNPNDDTSLSSDLIHSIYVDKHNRMWVCTRNGLNLFDKEKESFTRYNMTPDVPTSISYNYVNTILLDSSNRYWVGTSNGLNLFDFETEEFMHFYVKDGLPGDYIKSILEDNQGNLWISTNNGLARFNPDARTFRIYTSQDGLQSDEFNENAAFAGRDGTFYFGGINGFNAFRPDSILENQYVPPIVITDFRLFNEIVRPGTDGSPLSKSISYTSEIKLNYRQSMITFEFVSLSFTNPEKNQYAYKLEGFDKDWVYIGTQRTAVYTNLNPGEYVFRVKGSNNDNVWNEEGVQLRLVITPPFWLTWWFRILLLIFIIVGLFLLHATRVRLIRLRKKVLKRQVAEKTAEVKNQYKLLEERNRLLMEQRKELTLQADRLQNANTELDIQSLKIKAQAESIARMNAFLEKRNLKLIHEVKDIEQARIMQKGVTFDEFRKIYPDDESCYKFLDELKWSGGFRCRKCGSAESGYTNLTKHNLPYTRRCKKCKNIESPTVGTIFYHIKFPIIKAFYITFLVSSGKNYTADELSEMLSLRRQTAWNFQKKIKELITSSPRAKKNKDGWSHLILQKKKFTAE